MATGPAAAITSKPGVYANSVTLWRAAQMFASAKPNANARSGEAAYDSQVWVNRALASAARSMAPSWLPMQMAVLQPTWTRSLPI